MEVIFMLTRSDRTVANALEVLDAVAGLGLRHIGFKDLGADAATMCTLARRIHQLGATSYLETVDLTPGVSHASTRLAIELGVDRLLGGPGDPDDLRALAASGIGCYPFPGQPSGHPTRLGGSPALVARQCQEFAERGCAGVDLLAFRATEADPLDLVRAARGALGSRELIVAGSIDGPAKVRALMEAGVDAFTVGTAVLEGTWSPGKPGVVDQLEDVLAVARRAA